MNNTESSTSVANEEWRLAPLHDLDGGAPLRICVLVRRTIDPVEGPLYLLRDLPDARVYLGAVADAGGQVREWLELWFQNTDGLASALATWREHFDNACLDQRWARQAEAWRALIPKASLETGWETTPSPPAYIDSNTAAIFPLADDQGPYELCRNDAALKAAGLPLYGESLFRYLWQPGLGKESKFVPVTAGAPANSATRPLAEVLAGRPPCFPLNPQGGLVRVARFYPLAFTEYLDVLAGKPWEGIGGLKPARLGAHYQSLEGKERARSLSAHFFLGPQGATGRFIEQFQLKTQLMAALTSQAQALVAKTRLPLLNLAPESFRVEVGDLDPGLPLLWSSRCVLARPGQAVALPMQTTTHRYFLRAGTGTPSLYQPEGLAFPPQGFGTVRIRKVLPPERDGVVIEGTLALAEPQPVSPRDLLWVHMPLLASRVDLYGHAFAAEGLATGEIRFRTVPQALPEAVVAALRTAEGVPFARCAYEVVPLLSTPCDLYALGVLAVRTFLVDQKNTVAVALDELLSLARQLAQPVPAPVSLVDRIAAAFAQDARWQASLGPHRLAGEEMTPEAAAQLMPAPLWWETLAAIVRLFPGVVPESYCRDLGDAPDLALENVFNGPLTAWQNLLVRARSLIAIDWQRNREIRAVINQFRG